MREGADIRLLALLYRKKMWISIICALAGALLGGGLYLIVHVAFAPARVYEGASKVYLTFAADDDGDAYQYYNGYTWNDLMKTEPILDKILDELADTEDRQRVKDSITADILSDIRLLTVTVRTQDPAETERILRAAENALIRFGAEMAEFDEIEVIDHGRAALVGVEDETVRAVVAGGVIGLLLSLLGLALACVLDDSVYVPSDLEKRYAFPVLGVTFAGDAETGRQMLEEHIAHVSAGKTAIVYVDTAQNTVTIPEDGRKEDAGLILQVPYGSGGGKLLERWVREAAFMNREILGIVITDADKSLYRLYFGRRMISGAAGRKS